MAGTLKRRVLNVSFRLNDANTPSGAKDLDDKGSNNVNLIGHRVSAKILKSGALAASTAQVEIYGMTKSLMDKLCTQGQNPYPPNVKPTSVTIEAGDEDSKTAIVFIGYVRNAFGDYNSAPDVGFHIEAQAGFFDSVDIATPSPYKGPTSVEVMLGPLAKQMNLTLENNGVDTVLSGGPPPGGPYYSGSPRDQAYQIAQDAHIEMAIDTGKLAIWPLGQSRNLEPVKVSAATGMVGYPSYTNQGIALQCLFNPTINFGGPITVESDLKPANGEWIVFSIDYNLDSIIPNGQWNMIIQAARRGNVPVAIR